MLDDERPNEPDHPYPEPDPESDLPDPASELGPDPPEPPTPGADLPDEGDVDGDLLVAFWALVALANVALLGLAAGAMLLALTDRTDLGLALLAVGAAATVFGIGRYRRARSARETADDSTANDPTADDPDEHRSTADGRAGNHPDGDGRDPAAPDTGDDAGRPNT